jgi:hypothetical protein
MVKSVSTELQVNTVGFVLVSCSEFSSALRMVATFSSETSIDFQRTTWRYITEERILRKYRCWSLKLYMCVCSFPVFGEVM